MRHALHSRGIFGYTRALSRGRGFTARAIGVDFGTTNSVVAVLNDDAGVSVQRHGPALADVFRTVLCFWAEETQGRQLLHEAAGPAAIEA